MTDFVTAFEGTPTACVPTPHFVVRAISRDGKMVARKRKPRVVRLRASEARAHAGTGAVNPPPELGGEAQVKLALMHCIDEGLMRCFGTTREASNAAGVDTATLSRIHRGRHERVSISALLRIIDRLPIRVGFVIKLRRTSRNAGS